MYHGIIELPWWGYVVVALALTHITIASVTIYLHRYQAHRAIDLHFLPAFFFRVWLWLTTGMTTKEWVAIHRKHHAFVDREGDPHSPRTFGLAKVLMEGAELYREAGHDPETIEAYGTGAPKDWFERKIFTPHDRVGIFTMLALDVSLFGPIGLTIWAVQMAWIPIFAAGIVNGLGHCRGYRNFETADASTNFFPWGVFIGGEELHNNHHAFESSARFSSKAWEFDIGWLYIRTLEAMRLAKVKKLAPVRYYDSAKAKIDLDTLSAVISGRFYVMADYTKHVVKQVHREEIKNAGVATRKLLKSTMFLLMREECLMDENQRARLKVCLQQSAALAEVYEFRLQLQQIFSERAARPERLLSQLQEWCWRAEATGIAALGDFAILIRRYSISRP
ncbi:MAG TPA: acyl-CoA desaturase [Gammaproteobacteria bacterium]|nr:acyl-CoA desaturase [Gammaproteobacteria bacterium]|tara:strand:+ start:225 stop:1400 length:1176 start_codon:yes stop_codon:yes gene_type:complete